MKSREIVIRTLDFDNPERVARSFGDSDLFFASHDINGSATEWRKLDNVRWERTDEWGNTWSRIDDTSKGEVTEGVIETPDQIDDLVLPDFSCYRNYEKAALKFKNETEKFRIGSVPGFTFNIARKMLTLEDYLVYLLIEPEQIKKLHDKVDRAVSDMITNYGKAGADAIMFPEDWGTQNQTLVSPVLWRDEFYPRTKAFCSLAHGYGMKVIMHSCGAIGQIIPGLMEAGIDCLQFDQPRVHGIDNLAAHQDRGKITFWCPVDIQKTLQTEDEGQIRGEADELLRKLWKGRGGFIAGYYNDNASIGMDPMWQEMACDEFIRKGINKGN